MLSAVTLRYTTSLDVKCGTKLRCTIVVINTSSEKLEFGFGERSVVITKACNIGFKQQSFVIV